MSEKPKEHGIRVLAGFGFFGFWWEHLMSDETRQDQLEPATEQATLPPPEGGEEQAGEEKLQKLHQTVEMKDVGPCKKHIKVTVGREDIDRLLNEKYSELVAD